MTSGRRSGSIRQTSRSMARHSAKCKSMLETMNRSGIRPSRRICEGRKRGFHCWSTIRVLGNPTSAMADPIARAPAGAIFVSATRKGSMRVRWSNAQAITLVSSWRGASARRCVRSRAISPGFNSSSPRSRRGSSIFDFSEPRGREPGRAARLVRRQSAPATRTAGRSV